jgi:hypothetical protein
MPKNKMVCCNFCEKKSNQVNSMIEGSQNVDVELLVDGFNDAIQKMKEMLR